jgi:hypothetical protein
MERIQEWLYQTAEKKDSYELELPNILDVKSGVLLAIIALVSSDPLHCFTAAASASPLLGDIEVAFGSVLASALILAVCALWPRAYECGPLPSADEAWIAELTAHYEENPPDRGDAMEKEVFAEVLEGFKVRAAKNSELNGIKMTHLSRCFRFTVAAIALYLAMAVTLKGV